MRKAINLLYLSGPITDRPKHREEFADAASWMRNCSYSTINPLEVPPIIIPSALHEEKWTQFMRGDIAAMMRAEGIALLDGHENSRGSHLEKRIAFELGIPMMTLAQWEALA